MLVGNISSNNDGDGIYVGDEAAGGSGMLIEGNTTNNNKGYGIFVPKVSHTIKDNIANDNGSWGIWASEGSNGRVNIDGGGNRPRATSARSTRSRSSRCSASASAATAAAVRRPTRSRRTP